MKIKKLEKNKLEFKKILINENKINYLCERLKTRVNIKQISLKKNELNETNLKKIVESLKNQQNLQSLILKDNKFTTLEDFSLYLSTNTTLKTLNIGENPINIEGIKNLAESLKKNQNLKKLFLHSTKMDENVMKILCESLEINESLTKIDLSYTTMNNETLKILCGTISSKNNKITKINLKNNYFNGDLLENVMEMIEKNKIKKLNLNNNFLSDISVNKLINFTFNQKLLLSTLEIGNTGVGTESVQTITKMLTENNHTITNLNISKMRIEKETFLNFLFSLKKNTILKKLDIGFNVIEYDCLPALIDVIQQNTAIESLNLNKIFLPSYNLDHFWNSFEISRIKKLYVRFNYLKSIENISNVLAKNTSLTYLDFSFNDINLTQVNHFFDSLKKNNTIKKIGFAFNDFSETPVDFILDCLKYNNSLTHIYFEHWSQNSKSIKLNNEQINFMLSSNKQWNTKRHSYFSVPFKKCVVCFLLVIKHLKISIPKFVLFHIIGQIERKSFLHLI